MVRFMSARSEKSLLPAMGISVIVILIFDVGAVLSGMAGRVLLPSLNDPETIFPMLSIHLFPPVVSAILMVVVLAAIMSTVDSLLILASSAVVRDFLVRVIRLVGSRCRIRTGAFMRFMVSGHQSVRRNCRHAERVSDYRGLGAGFQTAYT